MQSFVHQLPHAEPGEQRDHDQLDGHSDRLRPRPGRQRHRVHGCRKQDDHRPSQPRGRRSNAAQCGHVLPEGKGQRAQGNSKPHQQRNPAGQVAERRVQSSRQEHILSARFGNVASQCAVAQGAEQGDRAPQNPDQQHQPGRTQISDQETARGEHTRAHHVRHHQGCGATQPEASVAVHRSAICACAAGPGPAVPRHCARRPT